MNRLKGLNRCVLIALLLVFVFSSITFAEDIPFAKERSQIVRVYLKRLGITDRMDLTLNTGYTLESENGIRLFFQPGSEISFLLRENAIYLYYQGMSQFVGKEVNLYRSASEETEKCGFAITNYPAMYLGDLKLDVNEGILRPVLSIHVEDYLLGVVPYEMSDSFPLEALKAQAVAARTYAIKSQASEEPYDVVDTTNDQVFKGYLPDYKRAEQAVSETRGVCGFYKGKLAQCYYAASNGGQTEHVRTVWPNREDYGYYAFGEDPYDVENPLSVVRRFELQKKYKSEAPYALRKLLAEKAEVLLQNRGFDPSPDSVRVDAVELAFVDTPETAGSKINTVLHLNARISGRTRTNVLVHVVDEDQEEVNLFIIDAPATTPEPVQSGFQPIVTTVPTATPAPVYGPFTPIDEAVSISISIFKEAEDVFGMDISSNYDNEIWSVNETEDTFVLEARRYGHGVGMSQRGAEWMAGNYSMSYQEILNFYYPGMELNRYPETPRLFHAPDEALAATAGPAPSPTPRPTAVPLTLVPDEGEWLATVTEISADSSLNLRSEPSLNGKILTRLYKGQELIVSERCAEEGWVKVRMDGIEGYVMESYLTPGK